MQYQLSALLPLAFLQSLTLAQSTFSCSSSSELVGVCCAGFLDSFSTSNLTVGYDCAEANELSAGEFECPASLDGQTPETSCCASVSHLYLCWFESGWWNIVYSRLRGTGGLVREWVWPCWRPLNPVRNSPRRRPSNLEIRLRTEGLCIEAGN